MVLVTEGFFSPIRTTLRVVTGEKHPAVYRFDGQKMHKHATFLLNYVNAVALADTTEINFGKKRDSQIEKSMVK